MEKERVITLLNKAVSDELATVHQYLYFHFHFNDQGYSTLADLFRKTAVEEMKHLERLADRILCLKGDVDIKPAREIRKNNQQNEMMIIAKEMELQSVARYKEWSDECSAWGDDLSKKLFDDLRSEEERHCNQFEAQIRSIDELENSYLAVS